MNLNYDSRVCSFTGYRTQKLNICLKSGDGKTLTLQILKSILKSQMQIMLDRGFTTFMSGMAIGADLMFAQAALELRKDYPGIVKLIAVIPCLEHDKNWGETERLQCQELITKADNCVLVSNSPYYDGCMAKRNRYLVNACDELLAIYDGQRGGTMQTINYAKNKSIKVTIIDPTREKLITLHETCQTEKQLTEIIEY
ncbi:MAG: DUF1273 domain-containing protein [Oscillospiraceae bacterium]|nr:DUF1273 domain-containing protein [Oscillospiraceae bacterium]